MLRDQRPAERGRQRIAILVKRAGLQRRKDVLLRELVAHVEDVRADRADRKRALADVGQLASLPEIERHGDHLGAICSASHAIAIEVSSPPE